MSYNRIDWTRNHQIHGGEGAMGVVEQDGKFFAMSGEEIARDVDELHSKGFAVTPGLRLRIATLQAEEKFNAKIRRLEEEKAQAIRQNQEDLQAHLARLHQQAKSNETPVFEDAAQPPLEDLDLHPLERAADAEQPAGEALDLEPAADSPKPSPAPRQRRTRATATAKVK